MNQLNFIAALRSTTIGEDQPDLNQVATFVEKNADNENVKTFLTKITPKLTTDSAKKYLTEDDEGKKLFNSMSDSKTGESIKTAIANHNEKTMPGLVEAMYQERHPDETDEQKANREMLLKIEALEVKNKNNELKSAALEAINEAKLPFSKIVDKFIGKDIESTISNIQSFEELWNNSVEVRAKEITGGKSGRKPHEHGDDDDSLDVQLAKAEKEGNKLEVIKLKNKIYAKKAS